MNLMLSVALSLALAAQTAPNFSGKWIIQGAAGRGRGGSAAPVNNEIYDGKVEGDTLSFYVWRGTDQPYKTGYKGTLNAAGDEVTFIVTGMPGRAGSPGTPQTLTAKRAK